MDLNDYALFAILVEEGSLAGAGRKLCLPRSTISRRLAALEADLGVQLIRRSTRSFSVSDLGQEFYLHCRAMLAEAEAGRDLILRQSAEPQGRIRVACPSSLLQYQLAPVVAAFLRDYPKAVVLLESTNRAVDLLREGFDIAIRVRFEPLEESGLMLRRFGSEDQHLVCAPSCLESALPQDPEALTGLPSLSWHPEAASHYWDLIGPGGEMRRHYHHPRFATQDMAALLAAALAGVGVVQLPGAIVRPHLASGALVELLPQWRPKSGVAHAIYPSRRGLLPVVRKFLDYCAAHLS